jgi:uncharacterized membrane protein YfcA
VATVELAVLAPLVGLAAGFLGAMFGLGGGFLMVPLLTVAGTDMRVAIGTSSAAILFNAVSAVVAYSRYRYVVYRAGLIISVASVATAYIGARLTRIVDVRVLKVLFGIVLIYVAVRVALARRGGDRGVENYRLAWTPRTYLAVTSGGLLAGLVAGLLGVGGGVVNVPLLTFLGVPMHNAVATSTLAIAVTSTSSAVTHYTIGNVDLQLLALLAPTLVVGAQLGAATAKRLRSLTLRRGFAALLVFIALRTMLS